jgi:hypothetical protein
MFKWKGWWTCKKKFGIWKYWKIAIYLIKNCPPKQTMTLLFWWLFLMWLQSLKDSRFMGTILNHHFHLNTSKKSSLCVLKWTFIHVAKVNPCAQEYSMMWHGICYKDSLLFIWARSPAHLLIVRRLMLAR